MLPRSTVLALAAILLLLGTMLVIQDGVKSSANDEKEMGVLYQKEVLTDVKNLVSRQSAQVAALLEKDKTSQSTLKNLASELTAIQEILNATREEAKKTPAPTPMPTTRQPLPEQQERIYNHPDSETSPELRKLREVPKNFPGYKFGKFPTSCRNRVVHPGARFTEIESQYKITDRHLRWYRNHIFPVNGNHWETTSMKNNANLLGYEIGALHKQSKIDMEEIGVEMKYIDKFPAETLKQMNNLKDTDNVRFPDIVADAETLSAIATGSADFYIASHVLEHTSEFLRALNNSLRILRPGGLFIMTLPDMCATFDRHRVETSWEHVREEFLNPTKVAENRKEHIKEYMYSHYAAQNITHWVHQHREDDDRMTIPPAEIPKIYNLLKDYPIPHFHTWTANSLAMMLDKARIELGFPLRVLHMSNSAINLHTVLQKVGDGLEPWWSKVGPGV